MQKEINPENSLEGLMLKLKLQYFGYLMQRASSLENTLMLGKNEGRRRDDRCPTEKQLLMRIWQRIKILMTSEKRSG